MIHYDKCSIDGCGGKHHAKSFCGKHYQRLMINGTTDEKSKPLFCYAPNCTKIARKKDLCITHYHRLRETGTFDTKIIIGDDKKRLMNNSKIDENGCWKWQKSKKFGYGCSNVNGKPTSAHRASWRVFVGEIPEGMQINHKCHNRDCINPEHLYVGTQKENMRDMDEAGRGNRLKGSKNPLAKLDENKAIEIKRLLKLKISTLKLGKLFNVSPSCIQSIKIGASWKHI